MAQNYEFTEEQNQVFTDLAKNVSFVGKAIAIIVGLVAITFLFQFSSAQSLLVVDLLVVLVIAFSHIKAAKSLRSVATTEGNDIDHLMKAMKNFNRFYFLYYWAFIIFILSSILSALLKD